LGADGETVGRPRIAAQRRGRRIDVEGHSQRLRLRLRAAHVVQRLEVCRHLRVGTDYPEFLRQLGGRPLWLWPADLALPVMLLITVSVAVTDCVPAVLRVTEKVCLPASLLVNV
jgi:hypothetical protein